MFSKINVYRIIKDHISTLKDYQTKKYIVLDFVVFFGVPLVVAVLAIWLRGAISDTAIIVITSSLSIFAALLFNLLLLIYDSVRKEETRMNKDERRVTLLKEVFSNISFCILVSVLAIIILIILSQGFSLGAVRHPLSFLSYYLVTLFILTLLMVLKRAHILLSGEFKRW